MHATAPHPSPAGAAPGLEALFGKHREEVLQSAYRITGSRQDAQDVLQTVFLRLLRRPDNVVESTGAASYLRRAAINAALDLIRARRRSGSMSLDELPAEPVSTTGPGTDRGALDRELRHALRSGLAKLSERAAEVFTLRYFEGFDNRDIADLLDMSPTAVAVSLHRARGRLQRELAPFAGGTP